MNPGNIQDTLEKIRKTLNERWGSNLRCLILYGSWAKGTAREDSDIDLLAIFDVVESEVRKCIAGLSWVGNREITLVPCTMDEFQKEKIPLYTAVKFGGKVIWGDIDRSINPDPPEIKYAEFFKRSQEFESRKLEMAEKLWAENYLSGIPEICFVAAKHSIQAALAMKGEGYSSKMAVLFPLAQRYFGPEIAETFQKLSDMYGRAEVSLESISPEEAKEAIDYARKIFEVYW